MAFLNEMLIRLTSEYDKQSEKEKIKKHNPDFNR